MDLRFPKGPSLLTSSSDVDMRANVPDCFFNWCAKCKLTRVMVLLLSRSYCYVVRALPSHHRGIPAETKD